jgi:two-component system, chemotaxis family, protein-glutamate methylesterase/glutaminase
MGWMDYARPCLTFESVGVHDSFAIVQGLAARGLTQCPETDTLPGTAPADARARIESVPSQRAESPGAAFVNVTDLVSSRGVRPEALQGRITAIVLGVSLGGVDALTFLLPQLPRDFRPALLIVLHIPAEWPSLLVDIFAPRCPLPVREAQDKEPVMPGTVYFAPPDYHLLVDSGPTLSLSVDEPVHYSRPSIDVLFESAAYIYGPRLAAIILTGANEDGAQGLATVRAAGGITLVQTPETAHVATMPAAALARGPADFVLTLEQLAQWFGVLGAPATP